MSTPAAFYTKPEWKITPERIAQLKEYAYELFNKTQIADCLGISVDTFNNKLKEYPEFSAAYETSRQEGLKAEFTKLKKLKEQIWVNATEPALGPEGNPIGPQGGIPQVQIFLAKSKLHWQDTTPAQTQVNIVIPPLFASQHSQDVDRMFKGPDVTVDV